MTTLHSFCTWLYTREITERVPAFPELSPPEPVIKWIDRETQNKILDVIPTFHKPIFDFMIHMPVRTQEARALKVKSINLKDMTVHIFEALSGDEIRPRKNKRPYYLPLYSTFDFSILTNKLPEAFVFNNREGKPYKHRHLVKIWETACKKLGVKIPLKCTRHSAASQAINRGVGLDIISKACGHSTIEVTKRYASMNVTLLKAVVDG